MSGAQGVRAGRAHVEVGADDSEFRKTLRGIKRQMLKAGREMKAMGRDFVAMGAGLAVPLLLATREAMNAQETLNKFRQVFSDQAAAAEDWANRTAKAVGRSRFEIYDALASFQAFFVGVGFGGEEARKMSQRLSGLSMDFASFHNMSDSEAVSRFISAMSGSSEVLDRFGVNLKVAALDQELLRMGFEGGARAAGEQQKALARLAVISKAMSDQGATGDAQRTSGSLVNQLKAMRAAAKDVAVDAGTALVPVFQDLLTQARPLVEKIIAWVKVNPQLAVTIARVAAGVGALGAAMYVAGSAMTLVAANPIMAVLAAMIATVTVLASRVRTVTSTVGEFSDAATKARQAGDEQRAETKALVEELDGLSRKTRLSTDEQKRATDIIGQLEGRYGTLGAVVDKATGRVHGLSQAQADLNRIMRQNALVEIDRELTELAGKAESVRHTLGTRAGFQRSLLGQLVTPQSKQELQQGLDVIDELEARMRALAARRKALRGGDLAALTAKKTDEGQRRVDQAQAAGRAEVEAAREATRIRDESYKNRIASMRDAQGEIEYQTREAEARLKFGGSPGLDKALREIERDRRRAGVWGNENLQNADKLRLGEQLDQLFALQDQLAGAKQAGLARAGRVTGTFVGAQIGMTGGSRERDMSKGISDIARTNKQIERNTREGGQTFTN